jgi:hypothetical protein
MILWLVALTGFLILSGVYRIVHILFLVVPATACLLFWCSFQAIVIAQWTQCEVQIAKYEITLPVCIIQGTDNLASGIRALYSSTAEVSGFLVYQLHINP